ncbi:MAG: PQQ-dependent sugar dehydrogenase [Thermoanaerobaculia bacterium]
MTFSTAHRRLAGFLVPVSAVLAAALLGAPAHGATSCFNVSCGTTCTPGAPVGITNIVGPSDFPSGANTPISFVDPNDGRSKRLIATQEGAILVWDGGTGEILPTMFLDLRQSSGGPVSFGGERGLLSMVADPDYVTNGRFYVYYTRRDLGGGTLGDVVIERYERSAGNPDVADPGSATKILVIEHSSASNHNGGNMAFGPDGFLYISIGDGGGGCDGNQGINGDGQQNTTLLGKMLRIDVRGIDPLGGPPDDCDATGEPSNYTVPSTNPFFGQDPACDEVWAMGLRNPFRFSFDRTTGDLYIGDVGQNKWEEINLKRAALAAPVNFGWSCREGCETSNNDESGCSVTGCPVDPGTTCEFPRSSGFWDPILCHHNGGWASVMGGFRYRGTEVPSIAGDYLYSDAACGQIWKTTTLNPANPAAINAQCWASGFSGTYGFAEDHLGELYVVVGAGSRIACIHNGEGCPWAGEGAFFLDGFESGDTSHWTTTAN